MSRSSICKIPLRKCFRVFYFFPSSSIARAKTKTFAMPYVIRASWGWRDRRRSFAARISAEFRGRIFFRECTATNT